LVVAADGAQSRVRQAAAIGTWGWDYDQRGLVTTVRTDRMHSTAWQRFLPNGPVALLPLDGAYSSVVWSTSPQHAAKLEKLSEADFVRALNTVLQADAGLFRQALEDNSPSATATASARAGATTEESSTLPGGDRLYSRDRDGIFLDPLMAVRAAGMAVAEKIGAVAASCDPRDAFVAPPTVLSCGPRASFPLRFGKANSYVRPRLALVGDAAHTIHPLAGQNLNLGLGDADALVASIVKGAAAGQDPGSLAVLRRYEAERAGHNLAMMAALDAIKKLFQARAPGLPLPLPAAWAGMAAASPLGGYGKPGPVVEPWIAARNVALSAINAVGLVKDKLAQLAMG
jgi:ubiquinone biosynthesis monooxygenase Coq6